MVEPPGLAPHFRSFVVLLLELFLVLVKRYWRKAIAKAVALT